MNFPSEPGGLKYPILLVHGMGFRDRKHLNYWGRIPGVLRSEGAAVFYGNQDSNGSIEGNAAFLEAQIKKLALENNITKFNVIAHSKGGLDIRYAISTLKMNGYVASVTTIQTPHHGSHTVDKLLKLPSSLVRFGCMLTDLWFRVLGDKHPQTYKAINCFKTTEAEKFNAANPDDPDIYYQSYAFSCKKVTGDMFLWFSNMVVRMIEGENDGLLTPGAVMWGDFKGHFRSATNRGISHCDEVDMRRRPLTKKAKAGDGICDIVDVYRDIVADLKTRGY